MPLPHVLRLPRFQEPIPCILAHRLQQSIPPFALPLLVEHQRLLHQARERFQDLPLLNSFPDVATVERCFALATDRLDPGGLLIADNALRRGEVVRPETRMAKNVVRWNQLVSGDERLESSLVPLRDGVMIARRRRS